MKDFLFRQYEVVNYLTFVKHVMKNLLILSKSFIKMVYERVVSLFLINDSSIYHTALGLLGW